MQKTEDIKHKVFSWWDVMGPRQRRLMIRVIEYIVYAIFISILIEVANSATSLKKYPFTRALRQAFLEREFTTTAKAPINFYGIKSPNDMWHFLRKPFLDGYCDNSTKPFPKILYVNSKTLGKARMRQLKVTKNSCDIHEYFRRQFTTCYGKYSEENEDTEPFAPESYGNKTPPEWVYNTAEETKSVEYTGKVATYGGGGFTVDFDDDRKVNEAMLKELFDGNWITRGTRCVFIDFTVYNSNLNLFCVIKIVFEYPPTGGVIPSSTFSTLKFRFTEKDNESVNASISTLLALMVFYTLCHLIYMYFVRWDYLKDFWNYWDIIWLCFGFAWYAFGLTKEEVVKKPLAVYYYNNKAYIPDFEYAAAVQAKYDYLTAVFLFLVCIRIFKFLSLTQTLRQLNTTLHECAIDVFAYSFVFFIIFFAFAECGCLLFGVQVEGFCTFGASMFTLLRAILGDFNYMDIYNADAALAPLFFLSYICFVFFLLLNIFLAIINSTYSGIKAEVVVAPRKLTMAQFLKKYFTKCYSKFSSKVLRRGGQIYVYISDIRKTLENCQFSDNARNSFYERYQIDPESKRGRFDINIFLASLPEKKRRSGDENVFGRDAKTQQQKLAQTEQVVARLTLTMDTLLKKMDTIRNIRKGPRK